MSRKHWEEVEQESKIRPNNRQGRWPTAAEKTEANFGS
jgi:hypothetical protein